VTLQLTYLVFENINAPDWVMQAIMLVLALGFPVAPSLVWAFEVTPDSVQREDAKPSQDSGQADESVRNSRLCIRTSGRNCSGDRRAVADYVVGA
jgi:hypothetical protein